MSLFAHDMIVYLENPKESTKTKTLLELINEFSKFSEYQINIKPTGSCTLSPQNAFLDFLSHLE